MSDQEHNNDPLERLFREKAEEYDIEYNEKDWLSLKDRLDEVDRQRQRTMRRRWIAAAVILTFAFLTYLTIDNQMQINRLNEKLSDYQSAEQEQPTEVQEQPAEGQEKDQSQQNETELGTDQKTPSGTNDQTGKTEQNLAAASDTTSDKSTGTLSDQRDINRPAQKIAASVDFQSVATARISPDEKGRFTDLSDLRSMNMNSDSPEPFSDSPVVEKTLASASGSSRRNLLSGMSLGLVMGPDLSTTGSLSNFYDPGYEVGVTVDYNLGSNWGISTGIIRSRVRYTASGSEYRPPQGYWSNGAAPQQTIGDCVLLDIPLRLKYDVFDFSGSRLYATAGVSSYIMLNEIYQFNYEQDYQSNRVEEWRDKTGTRHWMSNASLSVGYEYDFLRNWSVRAEPYLKMPIKEVGWGNVKLYSMGMTVSFNYNL